MVLPKFNLRVILTGISFSLLLYCSGDSQPVSDIQVSQKIVFQSDRDGNMDVFIMDADGANQINVSNNSAKEFNDRHPAGSFDLLLFSLLPTQKNVTDLSHVISTFIFFCAHLFVFMCFILALVNVLIFNDLGGS